MSYPNSTAFPEPDPSISPGFSAQSEMGLAEVLQMCCASRRSGQITFRSGESYGYVFIQQGRVLHAQCGTLEGEEAIYTMLTWPGGGFSLNEDILPHKKTVTLTWEQLLFEGARRADEGSNIPSGGTVITAEPVVSTRAQDSQPKLIVTRPDLPPITFELSQEYTHLGRAPGNEICLPYPSISNRHCIFILSGPDIVLRDLNSSNGTLVKDEAINEVVLRPGDVIKVGVVTIKFEAGMKRPKLRSNVAPAVQRNMESLKEISSSVPVSAHTAKLPHARPTDPSASKEKTDSAYVKGMSAINYSDLAKPEVEQKGPPWMIIIAVFVIVVVGGACYFYLFKH